MQHIRNFIAFLTLISVQHAYMSEQGLRQEVVAKHQLAIIKLKTDIIVASIFIPTVLARMIADFAPDTPPQWIGIIDKINPRHQHMSAINNCDPEGSMLYSYMPDFQLVEIDDQGLSVAELETSHDTDWFDDMMLSCWRPNHNELLEHIREKMNNKRINFSDDSWKPSSSKSKYNTSYHTMHVLSYLLKHYKLQLVAKDSELYQRAIDRSTYLLDSNTTWDGLGKRIDMTYKKLDSYKTVSHDDDFFEYWAIPYLKAYETSPIPRLLKKIPMDGNLAPVFYRGAKNKKKRKRAV